jgi:hypothetical protein
MVSVRADTDAANVDGCDRHTLVPSPVQGLWFEPARPHEHCVRWQITRATPYASPVLRLNGQDRQPTTACRHCMQVCTSLCLSAARIGLQKVFVVSACDLRGQKWQGTPIMCCHCDVCDAGYNRGPLSHPLYANGTLTAHFCTCRSPVQAGLLCQLQRFG